jgi:2-iminobutanoate/2-iminopropanoate deaminase
MSTAKGTGRAARRGVPGAAGQARPAFKREHVRTHAWHEARAFSSAVKVTGGMTIFLAGMTPVDDQRRLVGAGNFDQQVEQVWENIRLAVEKAGGTLSDIVTMTVFLTDLSHGNRFVELRQRKFGKNYPASALIGINQLALPGMLIEIQAIAVIP